MKKKFKFIDNKKKEIVRGLAKPAVKKIVRKRFSYSIRP
jgi:hypothetical protein